MKHTSIFCSLFVGLLSCTNDDPTLISPVDDSMISHPYNFNRRSFEEVVDIAEKSISILQRGDIDTRGLSTYRTLDLAYGVKAICNPKTRSNSADSNNDTLLYIINFKNDQGFAIVSASRHTEPLIAVVENGNFDPDAMTGNPAFDTYLQMAKKICFCE